MKRFRVLRYIAYTIEIIVFFIIQQTPGLIPSVYGILPTLLIPIACSIAMFEGPVCSLFYLLFLAIMGVPILSMELAIGRGSKKSTVRAYGELEKKGQKWHIHGYVALIGNYLLMMFYTVVAGWMLYYFYSFLIGKFSGLTGDAVTGKFNEMLSSPSILVITMLIITIAGFLICSVGLQNGVERVTKVMMIVLMVIMIFLAVYSFTMPGAKEGLKFYLVPDMQQIEQVGLFHIITNAMSQAFFTLKPLLLQRHNLSVQE